MAVEVYEEVLEVDAPVLEAVEGEGPLPDLRITGRTEMRRFLCVVLENATLRVCVAPDLGGRVLWLLDKRTSTELFPGPLSVLGQGLRGAESPSGLQLRLNSAHDRLNSLGPVDYAIDAEEGAVWLAESSLPPGISWHLRISLPEDRAALEFEARVLNRTFEPLPYNAGFVASAGTWGWESESLGHLGDGFQLHRFSADAHLAPRQMDHWTATLAPFSLPGVASMSACAEVGEDLRVQSARPMPSAKVFLLTPDHQTMEATLDFLPDEILTVPLGGHAPIALVIEDAEGKEALRWPQPLRLASEPDPAEAAAPSPFSMGSRHLFHLQRGVSCIKRGALAEADGALEQALLYNGDDPLLWWAKAVVQRLLGIEEERPELPNAHYLAPLEPALRAEAYLAQNSHSAEPSPLLKDLSPDGFVEVACLLLEHGFLEQAARWIEEGLRHHDLAMLRYLLAHILFSSTRMDAEAAQHVYRAATAQVPPAPWRAWEWQTLERLQQRFPDNGGLLRPSFQRRASHK